MSRPASRNPTSRVGKTTDSTGIPRNHQIARNTIAETKPTLPVNRNVMVSSYSVYKLSRMYPTKDPK